MDDLAHASHIGKYVKVIISKKMSIKEAAKRLKIGRPALSNFLNGNSNLSNSLAFKLQDTFGLDALKLIKHQKDYEVQNEGYKKTIENSYYDCIKCRYRITGREHLASRFNYDCPRCKSDKFDMFKFSGNIFRKEEKLG